MLRKVGLVSALLLALPAFASAWTVTAKIGSGQGTVSDGTKTIAKGQAGVPYIGYYKVANDPLIADQTFTVDPADGYSIASVILNGANVTGTVAASANGTYTVLAGTPVKNSQSLVVYFKQNLLTVDITQSAGGKITLQQLDGDKPVGSMTMNDLTNVKPGAKVRVTAMPNADYKVSDLNGAPDRTVYEGEIYSKDIIVTESTVVTSSFTQVPVVKPTFSVSKSFISPGDSITVTASSVSNMTGVTYTLTSDAADETVTGTGPFTVKFPTSGVYDLTLTATVSGVPFTITKNDIVTVQPNNSCTTCHSARNADITNAWQAGAHGAASGHTTGYCQRCHATEGAITGFAAGYTGGYAEVLNTTSAKTAYDLVKPAASSNGISCAVCHAQDPHAVVDGNILRPVNTFDGYAAVTWDPNGNAKLDQYDVCTACHTVDNNAGALVGNYHDGSSISVERTISDSHFDNPATSTVVEGYVVRAKSANPCADCHNLHSANVEIQKAWAKSNHAGKISVKKDTAAAAAAITWFNTTYPTNAAYPVDSAEDTATVSGSTRTVLEFFKRNAAGITFYKTVGALDDADGNAWVHYPWESAARVDCQHCHTATGAANFLKATEAGTAYDKTKNDFSHLSGWATAGNSAQQELLYCWGCHSDAQTGALHTTKAITLDYTVNGATTTVTAPDGGKSASCISCHSGRGNVDTLLGTALVNPLGAAIASPATKSHYLAAGLTLNQATVKAGYTFNQPASAYADPVYFKHNKLGCAECHMTGAEAHTFDVVEKDAAGVITKVASSKCVECHTGAHGAALVNADFTDAAGETHTAVDAAAFLEEEAEGYHQALEALKAALVAKGLTVTSGYPYISGTFANQGVSGAAYNYSYLHHEPGAYAHNRFLAKRLIWDSIDWLDNYAMDNSVTINATTYPHAATWLGTVRP